MKKLSKKATKIIEESLSIAENNSDSTNTTTLGKVNLTVRAMNIQLMENIVNRTGIYSTTTVRRAQKTLDNLRSQMPNMEI